MDSVFFVNGDIDVAIEGLTIQNGSAADGGGLYVQADGSMDSFLAVTDCVFKNNVAATGNGGALANLGLYEAVVLDGCTFTGNTALTGQGGAVSIIDGELALVNGTVSGNTAKNGGGCAFNSGASIALDHVTVTLNTATGSTASKGGGLYPNGASGTVANSLVCGNTDQFSGTATDNVNGTLPGGSNNLRDQDAMLGALADNGGPTPTHALLAGSPAINGGAVSAVTVDQRGVPRAQGNAPDVGAFEMPYHTYADDSYTAEACGGHVWGADAFATIQAAVNAVGTAGTVDVAAGTFNETVTLTRAVNLLGAQAGVDPRGGARTAGSASESIIHGQGTRTDALFIQGAGDAARVTGVVVDGFEVANAQDVNVRFDYADGCVLKNTIVHGSTSNEGIKTRASCASLLFQKVLSYGNKGDGIELGGYGTHVNHQIEDSEFFNNDDRGIYFDAISNCSILRSKAYGNLGTVGDWNQGGVILKNSNGSTLQDVEAYGNVGVGINLYKENYAGTTASTVGGATKSYSNTADASETPGDGIRVYLSRNVAINGAEAYGNARHGVCVGSIGPYGDMGATEPCQNITVVALNAHDNPGAGIAIEGVGTSDCPITGSTMAANQVGVLLQNGASSTVQASKVFGNTVMGVRNTTASTLNAASNWWGSASAVDVDAASDGPVAYIPFYTEIGLLNLAPYDMALSAATVAENTATGFAVGTLATTDDDTGDTFTYTLVAGIGDTGNGFFTIDGATLKTSAALDFETQPTLSVRIRTTDSHVNNAGAYDEVFTITVTDVNDAPVLAPIGPRIVNEDELLAFSISASDPDNDELAYTWQDVPAWATAAGTSFAGTPTQADVGTYNLTVTVTDGSLTDSENFTLTVEAVNDNPTVANALPDLNRQQDFATFTIPLAPVFADAENDALTYSVTVDGVINASVDGATLTLSSLADNRGTATVTVTATETATPEKLAVSDTFTVTVQPVWNTTQNTFFDTIQAAIDHSATVAGDVITVASGTYSGNLTISKGVALRSVAGPAATILIGTGGAAVKAESNGVEVTGFTIRNPSGVQGFYAKNRSQILVSGNVFETIGTMQAAPSDAVCGIMVWCTSTAVDTVVIRDNVVRLIESQATTKSAHGVWIGDSTGSADLTGLLIQSNAISQVTSARGAYGIVIGHARLPSYTGRTIGAQILDNTITDISGSWAHAIGLEGNTPNAVVSANTIARIADLNSPTAPDAVGIMIEDNPDAQTLTIASNAFTDLAFGVVNAMANPVTANGNYWGSATPDIEALVIGNVVAESFYADAALTDLRFYVVYVDYTFATESGNQFKTIQGGVNAVSVYGTVNVAAGVYSENVVVNKTVKLVGAGAATTTINGGNSGVVVKITANDAAMSGFTVTGSGSTPVVDAGVILQGATGCGIRDCVVSGNGGVGIGLQAANGNTIQDNTLAGNAIAGIGLLGSSVNTITGNTVTATTTLGAQYGYGIVLDGIDLNADGREDLFSTGNTIMGNTCTSNQGDGIYLGWACNGNTIAGNTLSANGHNGLYIWKADGTTIRDNTVSGNVAEGVQLMASANNVIVGNTISGSATSLWIRSGWTQFEPHTAGHEDLSSGNTIQTNSFLAMVAGVVLEDNADYTLDDAGLVDVSANYWGTPFGPSGDGFFGTGSALVGAINISSYFAGSPLTTLHYFDLYVDVDGIEDVNHFKTIQAAYAAANPGDTIHVADGGYTLGSTTFTISKPGLSVIGTGSAKVSIDASDRVSTAYGIHVATSDVTLQGFTLIPDDDLPPAGQDPEFGAGFPIHVSGTPGILSNITLRDIVIADSYRTPFDFNGVDNLVLDTLVASGADYGSGIGLSGCVGVTITGCQTADNAWGGVRVSGSTDVEPDRASSDINVDFAANTFAEVNALYIDIDGMGSTVDATGYSYKITTSAGTTTYLEEGYTEAQAIAVALGVESTFPGLTVTGLYEADGDPVLFDGEMSTAVVYVDDNWTNAVPGQGIPKPGAPGTYLQFGRNAFDTVQGGANGVAVAGTVHVANGLYKESNTTLSKPMTLEGETRSGVVIAPAAEDENLTTGGFTGVYQHGFVIAASDVTVTNLTIDGKANAALTEGKCNFRAGVMANGDIHSNVILASLTVRNTYLYGINMRIGTIGQGGAGSAIRSCWVENMGFNAYPSYGIYSTHAGVIAGNTVTNAGYRGIYVYSANMDVYDNTVWTGDYDPVYGSEGVCIVGDVNGNLSPAPVTRVYRNTIHVRNNVVKGIGMNVLYGLSSTFIGGDSLEDGNVIRLDGVSAADDGIECWWTKTGQPVIQNNTVYADNEDSAVWMFINRSKTEPVDAAAPIFKGNRFYATNSDGTVPGRGTAVFMTDDMRFFGDWMDGACYAILKGNLIDGFARGIDLYRSGDGPEDYDEREHTVQAVIGGANPADANTIQNCGVGVRLFVHPDAYDGPLAKVCDATILGNTTTFAGNDIAILIDGGSASVSQNGLYDNGIAIQAINGGSLTALDENTFEGGATHDDNGTDLLISATAGSVTIGTGNAFAGDLNFIDNRSVQNFDLTANSTTFDVADPYAIEDLVYHKVDEAACGLVRYAANKIYVTQSSGSIQRGIDAASAGDTVHVGAGTYLEQVTIAKALTVIGLDGAVLDGTGLGTTAVGVRIKSGNVTFDNVDVVSYQGNGIICGYEASIPGGLPNICIVNCRIADIQPGNSHGFGIYVGYESEGFGYVPPKLTAHLDYSGLLIASNEIVNTKCSGLVLQSITGTPGSLVVCDNNIHGITANSGIWVDCARNLVIEGNTVAGNKWGIEFSAYAEFGTLNGPYGPRDIVVRNNFVSGNAQQGLALYEGWPSTIAITQNSITGNGTGLQNYLDATVSAENNWWGNQTGPVNTANPGGTGDAVSGTVDFSPWLGDGTDTSADIGFQPNLTPVYYLPLGLKFTAQPGNANLGGSLGTVTVQVTNELGAVATQFTGNVNLAIASQPGAGVLTGTLPKACVAGEVSFSDLAVTLDGGTGIKLAASAAAPIAGATSTAFDIANPAPVLSSMSPIFAAAGSGDLTLTLSGSAFVKSSVVKWGAAETVLVPASVAADSITVTVPAALLATAGTAAVKVFSPAAGGGTSTELAFTITATALAPEVWVDDDWTGYADCGGHVWGYDAFATVQGGVNGAAAGATVRVAAGLYTEDVKIDRHVTLLGPKADAARNTGSATDWTSATTAGWTADDAEAAGEAVIRSAAVVADGVVDIAEDCNVTIKGFVVEARNRTDGANAHLIFVEAKNTTLQTVTIENNILGPVTGADQDGNKGRFGLLFDSQSGGPNGASGTVRGNKILGAEGNGANCSLIAQHYNPSMSDYSGMTIENNDIYGANRSGVEIAGGVRGLTVRDNWIAYNGYIWNGSAYVQSAKSLTVPNNIVYGAGVNLIRTGTICGTAPATQNAIEDLVLSGNTITRNEKSGVYVDAQQRDLSILDNEITENGRDGIWLDEYGTYNESKAYNEAYGYIQNAVVNGNRITGATGAYAAIRVVGKPPALSIADNNLAGNVAGVVQNDGIGQSWDYTADASGNWWGSADTAGVAALVAGSVDYTPWLAIGTDTDGGARGFAGDFSALWVDDDSVQAGTASTIQEGVDLVAAGGTVNVLSGTYDEVVLVEKTVRLQGMPGAVIQPDGTTALLDSGARRAAIWINGTDGVTVDGFEIDGTQTALHYGVAGMSADGLSVMQCLIHDLVDDSGHVGGVGINLYGWGQGVTGTLIESNVVYNCDRMGIAVTANESHSPYKTLLCSAMIRANQVSATWMGGFQGGGAIQVNGAINTVIEQNEIAGTAGNTSGFYGGIYLYGSSTGNVIRNNAIQTSGQGILLWSNPGDVVFGANLPEHPLVVYNSMQNLATRGMWAVDGAVNAVSNWWGDATGSAVGSNPGGIGEPSQGLVDFSPWLGDGTDTSTAIGFQPNLTPLYYLPVGIHFSTEPTGALLGAVLGTQPRITVTNEIGGVATQFNGSIALAIGVNPGVPVAGEMTGTAAVTVTNGVAIFDGLSIVKGTGNGYTLVATTLGLPAVTSAPFDIANSVPVLSAIGGKSVDEQAPLTFTATATDTAADLVAQTLTFSLAGTEPAGAQITTGGDFSWTPTEAQGGASFTFTVVVTDNGTGALFDSEEITVAVAEVNVAPVLGAVGDQSVDEQATLTFTAAATDQDLPAQTLTYSLNPEAIALGMSIDGSTGAFSWTPTEAQGGSSYSATITATDNGTNPANLTDSETIQIAVAEVNVAPVLAEIGGKSVNEQATLTFTAAATDQDDPAQTLAYSLNPEAIALGMSINGATGVFTWTPTEAQGGSSYSATITVTDNGTNPANLTDSETIQIAVAEVNVAPVLPAIADQTVDEQATLSFTIDAATDQDLPAQTLTYTLDATSVTLGMSIDSATGAFTWSPTEEQGNAAYDVTVTVTDSGTNPANLTAAQTFKVTVAEVNVAPVLAPIPPQSAVYGQTLTFTATAKDDDLPAQTLTYSLDGEPDGAVIDPASGVFTWTPTEAQAQGNFSFTVTVTDDGLNEDALSDSQTVTIGAIAAEQFCPGFRSPSASMVVSNSLTFGGTLTSLTWTPLLPALPAGWQVTAVNTLGNGTAAVDGNGRIVYSAMPSTSPAIFTYTVSVPDNALVSNALGATVSFNGLTAAVAPITVYRYHSADYRADISGEFVGQFRKIDSTEINRVLAYWRYGYKPDAAGYDGFVAMPGYTGEGGRHSADYQTPYWVIDTDEASLVQEYWRAGGYHADATTVDGYAYDRAGPGPSPLGGFSILALPLSIPLPPVVSLAAPETYNPGQSVTVTSTFLNNSTEKLLRFIWRLDVPEGWRITGVSGDGLPELDTTGTNVLLLAGPLPTSQISLTLTLSVPLNETRAASVGCAASYKFYGMTDLATVTTSTTPMAPLDADADGLADAWAAAYSIDDPDGDPDGDRMTNLDEYLCGTIPTDETSYLRMVSVKPVPGRGVEISWSSEAGRVYTLQRAVGAPVGLVDFAADLPADPSGRNTYLDDTGLAAPCFYRVKLQQ